MRRFGIAFLAFCFLAALVLPPLAMGYALKTETTVTADIYASPCHGETTRHSDKTPCGQDISHCQCCALHAAILTIFPGLDVYAAQYETLNPVLVLSDYQPELLLPPPEPFSRT